MNDLSILISSCENFSDLWPNIEPLFSRYTDFRNNIFLLSDHENSFKFDFIKFIYCDGEFSQRLRNGLINIQTDYVLLTLDDYYLDKKVNANEIETIVNLMKKNGVDYCRIYKTPKFGKTINKALKVKKLSLEESCYEVNLYPGIWKRQSLLKILSISNNENPWQFEVMLTSRCKKLGFNCLSCLKSNLFHFVDVIRKGKYLRSAYRHLRKNNLYISNRKKRTILETFKLNARVVLGKIIPMPIVRRYRRSRFNKSYSSYANTFDKKE